MAGMKTRGIALALVGFLVSVAWPVAVLAARGSKKARTPGAPELEAAVPGWAILCTLVALAGICVVAFKSSKRTHLD
jgi:formate hydrogenlyase subunit 3/multisubunit Na+/H+ antiporter MnhD subunit